MIENETKLDKKDLRYLFNRKLYSRWFNLIFRMLFFTIAIVFFVFGILRIVTNKANIFYNICFIILGIVLFILNLYLYNVYVMNKYKEIINFEIPRKYNIEKNYLKCVEKIGKKEEKEQIDYKRILKAKVKKDRIYIYYKKDEEVEIFSLHDDGYIVSSKKELIELLNNKHIKIKK